MTPPPGDDSASPGGSIGRSIQKKIIETYRNRDDNRVTEGGSREGTQGAQNAPQATRRRRLNDYQRNTSSDADIAWLARRYHAHQADEQRDTVAKRLARAAGVELIYCSCGETHPAAK